MTRDQARESARDILEIIPLVMRTVAAELTRRWPQLTAGEILESPYVLIGTIDQIVEDLEARRARWGISYYVVQGPFLDAFAPVVARLAGK